MMRRDILLIDDDEMTRIEFEQIFKKTPYNLHLAKNSIEGWEFIKTYNINLVFLDIVMPNLNNVQSPVAGIELLKKIKEIKPNLPILMITVVDEVKIAVEAMKLGAFDYIVKDELSNQELIQKVEKVFLLEVQKIEGLIYTEENEQLEFKSTLRWNLSFNKPDKGVELSWLKTLVAFMNTNGGILIIGVEDDKNILGIEADQFPNEDKYLLHFNNLFKQHIGLELSRLIKFKLITIRSKQVFFIECFPSKEPVFLKKSDEKEEFFIRVGSANRALSMSKMLKYLEDRKI